MVKQTVSMVEASRDREAGACLLPGRSPHQVAAERQDTTGAAQDKDWEATDCRKPFGCANAREWLGTIEIIADSKAAKSVFYLRDPLSSGFVLVQHVLHLYIHIYRSRLESLPLNSYNATGYHLAQSTAYRIAPL